MIPKRQRHWGRVASALVAVAASAWTGTAFAFCHTTTCDARTGACAIDPETGCVSDGLPLFWSSHCVSFSVQKDVAPGLSLDEVRAAAERAFGAWQSAQCTPSHEAPSITFADLSPVDCDEVQFNDNQGNANIIVFRQHWPEDADPTHTLALTTVSYIQDTGEILDADMEINVDRSRVRPLSTTENVPPGYNDLQSIMTHEAGHFIGLAHSLVPCGGDANGCPTMSASYDGGSIEFRTLAEDDRMAVCSLYPPDRAEPARGSSCVPAHGFAVDCGTNETPASSGCSLAAPSGAIDAPPPGHAGARSRIPQKKPLAAGTAVSALGLAMLLRRRATRRRTGRRSPGQ